MAAKRKMGRPSTYTEEIGKEICLRMAMGETVTGITKDDGIPVQQVIYQWRQIHHDFNVSFTRAREDQMHTWSDQIVSLIDNAEFG
ncbi:hypothetical protein A9Q94_15750 [Rhodobacterales bacterium 56_14_T64]|nr:hypothetical protein A9Q94_15750 [Rhodobacterales bacterium 56_14_T64]